MGRPDIWSDDIRELPWFGQEPGWPGQGYATYSSRYPRGYSSGQYTQYPATTYPGSHIQQQPGRSIVIQPGMNGMPATVSQVPTMV